MQSNEQMNYQDSKEEEPTNKGYYLGKTNLKVRLASDMDYGFLERLRRVLDSENSKIKT